MSIHGCTWIYLNKQSSEQLLEHRRIQSNVKYLRWSVLQKEEWLSVAEFASISLNIPKCPQKGLSKLLSLCQDSEYDYYDYSWSYMFNRLLKMPWVLNYARVLNMTCCNYARVTHSSEYIWICLNMSQ